MIDDGCERERKYGPPSKLKALGDCDRLDSEDTMDGLLENASPTRGEERNGREAWTEVGYPTSGVLARSRDGGRFTTVTTTSE